MVQYSDNTPPAKTMQFKFACTNCRQHIEQGSPADMMFALVPEYPGSYSLVAEQHYQVCSGCSLLIKANNDAFEKQMAAEEKGEVYVPTAATVTRMGKTISALPIAPPQVAQHADALTKMMEQLLANTQKLTERITELEAEKANGKAATAGRKRRPL